MKECIDDKKYSELFQGKKREALKTALDTRKFEIEMYWKRATYFWAFIAAAFAGYFALLNCDNINNFRGLTILVSSIGFFFSLGWHLVNRGSKFWQENWETHVSMLEDDVQGPLYKCVLISRDSVFNPKGHYPFSVSKINQMLSLFVTLLWFVIFTLSSFYTFHQTKVLKTVLSNISYSYTPYIFIGVLIVLAIAFFRLSYSFLKKKKSENKDANIFTIETEIMNKIITMGNDEFILYIRKWHPNCNASTKELGKAIWIWLETKGAVKSPLKPKLSYWEKSDKVNKDMLPEHATQFEFDRSLLPELYDFLDYLANKK